MSRSLTGAETKAQLASVQWEDAWPDPRDEEIARLKDALREIQKRTVSPTPSPMSDRRVLDWVHGKTCAALNGEKE